MPSLFPVFHLLLYCLQPRASPFAKFRPLSFPRLCFFTPFLFGSFLRVSVFMISDSSFEFSVPFLCFFPFQTVFRIPFRVASLSCDALFSSCHLFSVDLSVSSLDVFSCWDLTMPIPSPYVFDLPFSEMMFRSLCIDFLFHFESIGYFFFSANPPPPPTLPLYSGSR